MRLTETIFFSLPMAALNMYIGMRCTRENLPCGGDHGFNIGLLVSIVSSIAGATLCFMSLDFNDRKASYHVPYRFQLVFFYIYRLLELAARMWLCALFAVRAGGCNCISLTAQNRRSVGAAAPPGRPSKQQLTQHRMLGAQCVVPMTCCCHYPGGQHRSSSAVMAGAWSLTGDGRRWTRAKLSAWWQIPQVSYGAYVFVVLGCHAAAVLAALAVGACFDGGAVWRKFTATTSVRLGRRLALPLPKPNDTKLLVACLMWPPSAFISDSTGDVGSRWEGEQQSEGLDFVCSGRCPWGRGRHAGIHLWPTKMHGDV
jgi:hypothetical protein